MAHKPCQPNIVDFIQAGLGLFLFVRGSMISFVEEIYKAH